RSCRMQCEHDRPRKPEPREDKPFVPGHDRNTDVELADPYEQHRERVENREARQRAKAQHRQTRGSECRHRGQRVVRVTWRSKPPCGKQSLLTQCRTAEGFASVLAMASGFIAKSYSKRPPLPTVAVAAYARESIKRHSSRSSLRARGTIGCNTVARQQRSRARVFSMACATT